MTQSKDNELKNENFGEDDSIKIVHKINLSVFNDGPDQVVPAHDFVTTKIDGRVRIRMSPRSIGSEPPVSVPSLLRSASIKHPDALALVCKSAENKWKEISYKQYLHKARTVAKAYLKLGLKRYHTVAILGFNSPEWFIADIAAIFAGGIACGIYTTNTAEACEYCLHVSRANICVVQNQRQLEKILSVRKNLPHLKAIIQWEKPFKQYEGVLTWERIMEMGTEESDEQLDAILKTIAINEACTLVFTSGTVTNPKAVMLSHDNLTWNAIACTDRTGDFDCPGERIVSFLPLSHVAAQMCDIYLSMVNCFTVYFAPPDALKGSIVETLKEVRPTRFFTVPRLWEKMHDKMRSVERASKPPKRYLINWAKSKALEYHRALMTGKPIGTTAYSIAKNLVLNKVRDHMGLDECRTYVTAAAPLSTDIKEYFLSFDIPITDVFGMSETSGPHTLSIPPAFKLDAVGEPLEGAETKFFEGASPNGPGEICMRGRHVFMGYLSEPQLTAEAIDRDGWLHSGDIGKIDSRNMVSVTGRIKELIITAGGENVAPVLIEQTILSELPYMGYAVVIGDARKYLSVLLTVKCVVNLDTFEALDEIDPEARRWLSSLGFKDNSLRLLASTKPPEVMRAIQAGLDRANDRAISNAQRVQKFALLPKDFSIATGELGPTMKVKRSVVYNKYKTIIETMYND